MSGRVRCIIIIIITTPCTYTITGWKGTWHYSLGITSLVYFVHRASMLDGRFELEL